MYCVCVCGGGGGGEGVRRWLPCDLYAHLFGVLPFSTVLDMRVHNVQEGVNQLLDQLWRISVATELSQYPKKERVGGRKGGREGGRERGG